MSTRQFKTKKLVSSHPANRKPRAITPKPTSRANAHFIAGVVSILPFHQKSRIRRFEAQRSRYVKFTSAANDFGSRLAPPTSAPSSSSCAINP